MRPAVLFLFFLFAVSTISAQFHDCAYVTAEAGAKVYLKPDTTSGIIKKLVFGTRVKVLDTLEDITDHNNLAGTKEKARWLKVNIGPFDCHGVYGKEVGYISDVLIGKKLEAIPAHSIYYYYSLSLDNDSYRISYYEQPFRYSANTECCYQYFLGHITEENEPRVSNSATKYNKYQYIQPIIDTFKSYFKLEPVDPEKYKEVINPYKIDTTPVHRVVSQIDYDKGSIGKFYVFYNEGKDSILVTDLDGEIYVHRIFVGQIPGLNQYVINEQEESHYHYLVDKKTGSAQPFTFGTPYVSPDGKYIVDFHQMIFPTDDNGCYLTISKLEENLKLINLISMHFKSWAASEEINAAYWVSDRELVMKVMPIDNLGDERPSYRYFKLTILE